MDMNALMPWTRRTPETWQRDNDPFLTLQSEMNRLFDDVFRGMSGGQGGMGTWPRVDLTDNGDHVRINAELPGMSEDDINITLKDGVLSVSGERTVEEQDADKRISERYVGRFVRHIPLGYEIDEDKVEASFDRGELTIKLPKTESDRTEARRIEVKKAA